LYPGPFANHLAGDKQTSIEDIKKQAEKWIMIKEWEKTHQDLNQAKNEDKGEALQLNSSR
jgi:hypothetical protein